jgi:ribosomal protein S3AE
MFKIKGRFSEFKYHIFFMVVRLTTHTILTLYEHIPIRQDISKQLIRKNVGRSNCGLV